MLGGDKLSCDRVDSLPLLSLLKEMVDDGRCDGRVEGATNEECGLMGEAGSREVNGMMDAGLRCTLAMVIGDMGYGIWVVMGLKGVFNYHIGITTKSKNLLHGTHSPTVPQSKL